MPGRTPLRVALLVPERLPAWLKNSDIHQNRTLLELGRWTEGRLACVPMAPAPSETAFAAIAPLAVSRGLGWIRARGAPDLGGLHRAVSGVAWITRPLAADVVLGHGLFPVYAPWVRRRPPLVWGPGYQPADLAFRERQRADPLTRARLAEARLLFLSNPASADALRADFALPEQRVRVLPLFEPHLPASDRLPARPDDRAGQGPLRVLFVGREARHKNLPGLLAARRLLAARGVEVALTVVSEFRDGPIEVDDGVTVVGPLSAREVFARMQRCDVLCVPSFRESYGMVFIEALAAGAAVVAPDAPIQRSMLGAAGTYALPDDVSSIADALEQLAQDEVREARVAAGRELYRARYAPDVVAAAFEAALREAVARASPRDLMDGSAEPSRSIE